MKFLEKIGIGKKKEEEEVTVVAQAQPKESAMSKISNVMNTLNRLNKPIGAGFGFGDSPKRTPREKQLGIPEYVAPRERAKDFSITPKEIPKPKKVITNWRPTPGKRPMKGEEVKW